MGIVQTYISEAEEKVLRKYGKLLLEKKLISKLNRYNVIQSILKEKVLFLLKTPDFQKHLGAKLNAKADSKNDSKEGEKW